MKKLSFSLSGRPSGPGLLLAFLFTISFLMNPAQLISLYAQENRKPAGAENPIRLSPDQLRLFQGYFQNSRNKELYVQIMAKEDGLMAKLLWNNQEIQLKPVAAFDFISNGEGEEGPTRVRFGKDSTGALTQLYVGNNDLWTRAKNYKQPVKVEMAHTPEQLKPFEGLYQFRNDPTRFIQFRVAGNNLILRQHWDKGQISFLPESELDFFSREAPLFSLKFTKDKDGNITQVVAFNRDSWDRVKKPMPNPDQLKLFEGKFQFKDDPDNYIQIVAKENHLILRQLWDKKEIMLEQQSETYFYNEDEGYPLLFFRDENGKYSQLLVLGIDTFNRVKE